MRLLRSLCLVFVLVPGLAEAYGQLSQNELREILNRAFACQQAGELEKLVAQYERFLESGQRHPDIISNLGAAYAGLGNYAKAIVNYEQAIALREDHRTTCINLGLVYYKAAEPGKAIEQFTKVLAVDPENLEATSLLADCYFRLDQYQEVIEVPTPFENGAADNPGIAYLLGTALIRENRPDEGQQSTPDRVTVVQARSRIPSSSTIRDCAAHSLKFQLNW